MWLSVAGLLAAGLAALLGVLTSQGRALKKLLLGSLAFIGFVVGLYGSVAMEESQRKEAFTRAAETQELQKRLETAGAMTKELQKRLETAGAMTKELQGVQAEAQRLKAQLETAHAVITELRKAQAEQAPLIRYISDSLGDLHLLTKLSAGKTYYVRIAAAGTESGRADLEDLKQRIASEFPGAAASGMLAIIPFSREYNTVQLVFGKGLTFAEAEVFLQLARAHHFANAEPKICAENGAQDAKKSETH
jgi:cell fate (sporulation/competence/biofilm development) regulator YmcA (YheA/YmcA/DUF963 family)